MIRFPLSPLPSLASASAAASEDGRYCGSWCRCCCFVCFPIWYASIHRHWTRLNSVSLTFSMENKGTQWTKSREDQEESCCLKLCLMQTNICCFWKDGQLDGRLVGLLLVLPLFCAFLAAILADDERHSWREEDDELMPMPSFNADEESDKEKRWWILLDFDDVHLFRVRLQCLV